LNKQKYYTAQFTRFVLDSGDARAKSLANFLLDVSAFRMSVFLPEQTAASSALRIIEKYLIPNGSSVGNGGDVPSSSSSSFFLRSNVRVQGLLK
jgi:hypothetical protein